MIHLALQEKLQQAVLTLLPDTDVSSVLVRPCPEPKFGDYQTNALIGLAKRNELNPREFAAQVVEQLDIDDCCEPVEIAGPGFLNFRLKIIVLLKNAIPKASAERLCSQTDIVGVERKERGNTLTPKRMPEGRSQKAG